MNRIVDIGDAVADSQSRSTDVNEVEKRRGGVFLFSTCPAPVKFLNFSELVTFLMNYNWPLS